MTGIGWEFWGLKFSFLITALVSIILALTVRLTTRDEGSGRHVDTMAGDEGEEW